MQSSGEATLGFSSSLEASTARRLLAAHSIEVNKCWCDWDAGVHFPNHPFWEEGAGASTPSAFAKSARYEWDIELHLPK